VNSTTHNPPPTTVSRASVRAWLSSRRPEPPDALRDRIDAIVSAAPDSLFTDASMASIMGALGIRTLHCRLAAPDSAMDLLAADAFVTYAFEAASEEGADVTGLAERLLANVQATDA
jgi:hypothetical protein